MPIDEPWWVFDDVLIASEREMPGVYELGNYQRVLGKPLDGLGKIPRRNHGIFLDIRGALDVDVWHVRVVHQRGGRHAARSFRGRPACGQRADGPSGRRSVP